MKRLAQFLVILILVGAGLLPSAVAKKQGRLPLSPKVLQARSALIVCECPRGMAVAEGRALQELQLWGRFQIVNHRDQADLSSCFPLISTWVTTLHAMVPIRDRSRLTLRS